MTREVEEAKKIFSKFTVQYLFLISIFSKSVNISIIANVIILRRSKHVQTRSLINVAQRIVRNHFSKEICYLVDLQLPGSRHLPSLSNPDLRHTLWSGLFQFPQLPSHQVGKVINLKSFPESQYRKGTESCRAENCFGFLCQNILSWSLLQSKGSSYI